MNITKILKPRKITHSPYLLIAPDACVVSTFSKFAVIYNPKNMQNSLRLGIHRNNSNAYRNCCHLIPNQIIVQPAYSDATTLTYWWLRVGVLSLEHLLLQAFPCVGGNAVCHFAGTTDFVGTRCIGYAETGFHAPQSFTCGPRVAPSPDQTHRHKHRDHIQFRVIPIRREDNGRPVCNYI